MTEINQKNSNKYTILSEENYDISVYDQGMTLNKFIHCEDMLEDFKIRNPKAKKADKSLLGKFSWDTRHNVWINSNAGNDTKVLFVCDSYINSFIIEDFAESFASTCLIWGAYTKEIEDMVEIYEPDIVILESAERSDINGMIKWLSENLTE